VASPVIRCIANWNWYVEAGMTPLEAQIAAGMIADLVLADGRPDENISALRSVQAVVRNGHVLDPKALWRVVGFVP
jgi:hypothetical protein